MTIAKGDRLPDATLLQIGDSGPEQVDLKARAQGRKLAIFAVPGAFTPTCHSAHVPSFIRARDDLKAKGVDEILCLSVNDPFVMQAWGAATGAAEAGIAMLADSDGAFTRALGMDFDAPPAGLLGRSKRYAMVVEDGVVTRLYVEENPGQCEVSTGESLVAAL